MKKIILTILSTLLIFSSYGQTSDDVLKLMVDKGMVSQEEVSKLQEASKKKEENMLKKIKTAFTNSEVFRLSGYGQLLYYTTEHPTFRELGDANNGMRVNRAILFATGNLTKKLSYMIMYDFGSRSGLHELYGEYTFVDAASVRFGQYKIPFTLENPISPTKWEGIYTSLSVNALVGGSADVIGAKAGRDMGVQVSGKLLKKNGYHNIEYFAGLFNGTGLNTLDNNNHKDFAGTLTYLPIQGLKLSGSVYAGEAFYDIDNPISGANRQNHVRNRWSLGSEYDSKHIYARAEYLNGNDGGRDKNGYYGVGMWRLCPNKFEVFGKYDYFNSNKDTDAEKTREITAGASYYLSFLTRIQLNYIYSDHETMGANNMLAAQLQLVF